MSVFNAVCSFAGTPPNANFSYSPVPVCTSVPIHFTDLSTSSIKIVTWNWTFGSGASLATFNGKTPPSIQYFTSGNKSVSLSVTDSLGGIATSTQIFNVQAALANAGNNQVICASSSVQIGTAAIVGYSYNWTPANGLSSSSVAQPLANPTATTTYTLTTVASNGCAATSQVVVTNIGVVVANAGIDKTICNGSSTSIGGVTQPYYSYFWSPASFLSTPNLAHTTANPTTNSTYELTVQAGGCIAKDTVVINVNPIPVVSPNDTIYKCATSSVTIGGAAVAGYSYAWLPNVNLSSATSSNPNCNATSSLLYTETITNSFSCSAVRKTLVSVFAPLQAFAGLDQSVCFGNSIILGGSPIVASGGSGNYNYNWQPTTSLNNFNSNHPTATPIITTTYHLTVTDQLYAGCGSATDSVVLNIVPLPHPSISMPTEFCTYSSIVNLTGTPSGGTFSGLGVGSNNSFNPNDPSITLGVPFPITYTYNYNGCIFDTAISVVVYPRPIADAGTDQLICINMNQHSVVLNATGGTTYLWSPSSTLSNATVFNPIASPIHTTKYYVDVTLNGCVARDSVTITVSSTCGVDSVLIANPDFVRVPTGKTSLINYVANDDLLNGSMSFSASIFAFAKHGTALVIGNNPIHYTPNQNFIGIDTFVYLLLDTTVGAFHNHPVFDTAHVIVFVTPMANDDDYFVHCADSILKNPLINDSLANGMYAISVTAAILPHNGTILWNNNFFSYVPNSSFVGQDSFAYAVCANGQCDTAWVHFTVSCVNPPIAVDDHLDVPNNETSSTNQLANDIYDASSPISIYIISNPKHGNASIANNDISYISTNGYVGVDSIEYVICNAVGCDTAWIILKVYDNSPCQIPNGFSPNGDGINDYFVINCASLYEHNKLIVFNRWGNEVYSKTGYNNEWDGTYKNNKVADGTYYYVFEINDGKQKPKSGFIEIRK